MALERSEGVLCLVGAETPQALAETIARLERFVARSTGIRLIDVVYTATCDARGKQCVAGLWVSSLDEMGRKLRFALEALRSGRTRTRDKSGVFFTTAPLALRGGKVAYVFPGTGSFHLEMMRDLALTFDGVRERFDDMEEAFAGFCDVASPSEWLFSTAPEHTLPLDASKTFLPLLASASTYLASKVFADLLKSVGVRPEAVGGVGLGAFSAFHATHHDPKLPLVQILRDAGRMLLRLGSEGGVPWIQLTVSGIPVERLRELALRDPARVILTQILTADDCVMAVAPEKQAETEVAIHNGGGHSVAEPLAAPFNSGHADARMRQLLRLFFAKYVSCEPQIPFYSCIDGHPMEPTVEAVVRGLTAQMIRPLNFRSMIERMYDDGCRLFVEVGARGLLTPLIAKILAGRDPVAVIPMHILHRSGGVQVGQALGLLAAHGVPLDYSGLRFFAHAQRLDLSAPIAQEGVSALTVRLTRQLPAIRPELIDPRCVLGAEAEPLAPSASTHQHTIPAAIPVGGLECPLLRTAREIAREPDRLDLRCVLKLEDYPYLNDYAIGSSGVSLGDPQMRGLTLFSVPTGLELMAEAAHRLFPNLALRRIERLRAPRWLAFAFGRLTLRVVARDLGPNATGRRRTVSVRIYAESGIDDDAAHPAMEAHCVLSPTVPEPPDEIEPSPLAGQRPVNWKAQDIYPARLFQGPLLRNVREVLGWGLNGLDYEVRIPDRVGLVRQCANPLFCAMPLLLDAVVSGFPLWRSHERFHGAISLPFRCKAIRYYAAWVPQGTRLRCSLRLTNVTIRSFQVSILVTDATGHLILSIEGWEEVGGRAGQTLHDFVMDPARYFITKPLPISSLLPIPQGQLPEDTLDIRPLLAGDTPERTFFGALYVNDNPDFFTSNRGLWLSALAAAVHTRNERRDFSQMGGTAPRRLEWLLGRVAAKESVRRLLLTGHNLFEPSADIAIWKDDLGKPHPIGAWQSQVPTPIDLSIAHTAGLILGAATTVGRIGLDVESTSRDLTEDFLRGVLTLEEQELATRSGDGPIAVLRFWCAKEAISKALGTGIRFAPTDLRIRASDPADGMLAIELLGAWSENFPTLRGKRIPIKTAVLYDHAIACCVLPSL